MPSAIRRLPLAFALMATIATCRPAASGTENGEARVAVEIARLEALLKSVEASGLPKDVQPLVAEQRQALEAARGATGPGYRLYRLRDPFVGIETLSFLAREKASAGSLEKFRELWVRQRSRYESPPSRPTGPLLVRALAESAATRSERLFRASLPYAKASAPWSGVYYLGEAEGNRRFRDFLQSLGGEESPAERSASRDRLRASLEALERDTLKTFGGDVTNQKLVAVSVRLKEAAELLDAGRLDGATLLLVEARLALSRRGGPRPSPGQQAAAGRGSFAAMLEAWAAAEEPQTAAIVRADVVPFFGSLLQPAAGRERGPSAVTVTLVRWPYT